MKKQLIPAFLFCLVFSLPTYADVFSDLKKEFQSSVPPIRGCTGMLGDGSERRHSKYLVSIDPVIESHLAIRNRISASGELHDFQYENAHKLIYELTLSPLGKVLDLKIVKSSGLDLVDESAKDLITKAFHNPFPMNKNSDTKLWVIFFNYPNVDASQVYVKAAK